MTDYDVIVVGAGPAGLLAASELRRHGVDAALFEARETAGAGSRAIGIHPPVLSALEPSGVTDRLLAGGARIPRGQARTRERVIGEVSFARVNPRFPFVAAVPQAVTEAALAHDSPAPLRGRRVDSVDDRGDHVEVRSACGTTTARAVVLAAGATGRHLATGALPRTASYRDRYVMADLAGPTDQPEETAIVALDAAGVLESFPLPRGGRRVVAWIDPSARGDDPAERLRTAISARTGDFALAELVTEATSFGIRRVLVRRMRRGRVFVIGDAAHEISPIGGQGMNLGLLDAATLAPLLARRLRAPDPDDALAVWEKARLVSARRAASISGFNTAIGRGRAASAHRRMTGLIRAGVSGPFGASVSQVLARAYAMGFDRDASVSR